MSISDNIDSSFGINQKLMLVKIVRCSKDIFIMIMATANTGNSQSEIRIKSQPTRSQESLKQLVLPINF